MATDNSKNVMTSVSAVIKINGVQSGFMRNVTLTENIQRGEVKGISNLTLQEVPAVGYTCNLTCDFYFISLDRPEIQAFIKKDISLEEYINTLILGETPTQLHIYRKLKISEENGVITEIEPEGKTIGVIEDFYLNSMNMNVAESQISGMNVSGVYLNPILTA